MTNIQAVSRNFAIITENEMMNKIERKIKMEIILCPMKSFIPFGTLAKKDNITKRVVHCLINGSTVNTTPEPSFEVT